MNSIRYEQACRSTFGTLLMNGKVSPVSDNPFLVFQYTISGKKVEVAVKQVIAGWEVAQRATFSNPDSLDLYKNIPELQNY